MTSVTTSAAVPSDPQERVAQLNQLVVDLRSRIAGLRAIGAGEGDELARQALDQLRHADRTLLDLKSSVERLEAERDRLQALAAVGQVVNSSLHLPMVLKEVIDTIIRLTGAERAFLMLKDQDQAMEIVVARNWERASLQQTEVEMSRTVVQRVVDSGEPVLTTNARADPRFSSQDSVVAHNLRSLLCVPLNLRGQLIGVVYADNRVREGVFGQGDLSLLTAFANQAAVAVENARLFESVEHSLEAVTGLKNLMEAVFESIASGVITADTADRITLVNRAAETILNVRGSDLLGSSLAELLGGIAPDLSIDVERARESGRGALGIEVRAAPDGREAADLVLNISPLRGEDRQARGVAVVIFDRTEHRRLQAQRSLFERMVSPAVIEQLDPDSLHLGGRRAEITTLFADIRGFTSFSETNSPEILMRVLNLYLAAAADAVLHEEGTVEKFQGDAIIAWFNAPIPQSDHTLRAIRAALGIRQAVRELHGRLPPQFRLSFGMGIHYGEALLGLVGTERRLDYTAVGDSVNTAERLEEAAGAGQILVSRAVADRVRDLVDLRPVPTLLVAGKRQPVEVFELVGLSEHATPSHPSPFQGKG